MSSQITNMIGPILGGFIACCFVCGLNHLNGQPLLGTRCRNAMRILKTKKG